MGRIVSVRRRHLLVAVASLTCAGAVIVGVANQSASASRRPTAPSDGSVIGGIDASGNGVIVNAPGMWFSFNGAWQNATGPVGIDQVMPRAGTARALHVFEQHQVPPTSVGSLTFTIWKNDAPTDVSCEVPAGSTSCSDDLHLARFAEGDRIALQLSSSLTVDAGAMSWSAVYDSAR
jgi:hypothetical protein